MTARLHITRYRKADDGLLSKRITLGKDGKPHSDGSPCQMWAGTATRVEITRGAEGLAELISSLDSSEALGLGVHSPEAELIRLVLNKHANPEQGLYSRTLRFFSYQQGKPAVGLFDYDRKGIPDNVAARIDALGGFEGMMATLLPGLPGYARVIRSSTSSGLYNLDNGEQYPSGAGCHLYFFAQDGTNIDRFLRVLLKRAWLAGFGWINLSKAGSCLIRGPIDTAVGSPERLVFEGAPLVVPPLAQDQEKRRPIAYGGELIDTRAACPDLTEVEERQYEELVAAAKAALKPEIELVVEAAAEKLAEKRGINVEQARKVIEASHNGELWSWDSVHFDDPELGEVEVADILADPERYHGETMADPLAGVEYGTGKAKLYYNAGGDVRINSFAHGEHQYRLLHNPEYVELRIEEAGENAPYVLAALVPFMGGVDAVVRERLRNLAAKVSNLGRRTVNEIFKQAQAKARKEEKEHRARGAPRGDGKPKEVRQQHTLLGGQRPMTLQVIERRLRDAALVKAGAILARGQTQVVFRFAAEPVKIKGGGDNAALPAGSAYLASAKPEHLQAQLDNLFAFYKVDKDGEAYPTDCPNDLARHVLVNASLLPVMSISRTPVLRADGSVIETPGYDAATGIIYAPDTTFPPVPEKPTKGDAQAALKRLRKPFRDFPFLTEADLDAVIAELLTILVRHLVPIAPAFVHNAVEAGSGKTKLFNTVSIIAMGTPGPTLNAEVLRDETELRKLLTTLTLAATPFAVFDNTARGEMVASPGLANFLTAALYGDRLLGANEEVKAPTCTVLGITGNKIEIAGDLTRRMIRVDLDAGCERPETRHFDFDCEAEARRDRAELVVAALTLLKAHALAEWSRVEGRALLGSYEDWDRLVVGAIVFAGGADIVALMERTRSHDPERDGLAEVLTMLVGLGAITGHGMKAGEIIAAVRTRANAVNPLMPKPGDDAAEEWMAIVRRLGKDGVPEPRRLGRFLKKNAGRLVRGMRLSHSFDTDAKVERYFVKQDAQEVRGNRGKRGTPDPNPESCEKNSREGNRNKKDSDCKGDGANPGNHGNPGGELEDDEPWEEAI